MADSILSEHIRAVGDTLAPEHGPETPGEAVARLLAHYESLGADERYAFVAALVGEVVAGRALDRARGRS